MAPHYSGRRMRTFRRGGPPVGRCSIVTASSALTHLAPVSLFQPVVRDWGPSASMRVPSIFGALGAIVLAAALGCGPKPETVSPGIWYPREPCTILSGAWGAPDTIIIALFDAVEPSHAPVWRNAAEQLVFSHLYETLIETPCPLNDMRPGLASVEMGFDATRATLTIREGARFWDGTPVTSGDVVACLMKQGHSVSGIDSAVAISEQDVAVYFARPYLRSTLSSPEYAITKPSNEDWVMGTGPYRVAEVNDGGVTLRPFETNGSILRFTDCRNSDPRDLLDASSVDAMVVDSYETVSYAQRQRRFATPKLPCTKTYVLISTSRVSALQNGDVLPQFPEKLSGELARDAVRSGYARHVSGQPWWDRASSCSLSVASASHAYRGNVRRILYDASDRTARDLTERLVSLASGPWRDAGPLEAAVPDLAGGSENVAAVGVSALELASSLSRGSDFAYIVPLPFDPPDRCRAAIELFRSAPWLAGNELALSDVLLPLVSTNSVAIVVNRRFGLACDRFGSIRIFGWTAEAEVP